MPHYLELDYSVLDQQITQQGSSWHPVKFQDNEHSISQGFYGDAISFMTEMAQQHKHVLGFELNVSGLELWLCKLTAHLLGMLYNILDLSFLMEQNTNNTSSVCILLAVVLWMRNTICGVIILLDGFSQFKWLKMARF